MSDDGETLRATGCVFCGAEASIPIGEIKPRAGSVPNGPLWCGNACEKYRPFTRAEYLRRVSNTLAMKPKGDGAERQLTCVCGHTDNLSAFMAGGRLHSCPKCGRPEGVAFPTPPAAETVAEGEPAIVTELRERLRGNFSSIELNYSQLRQAFDWLDRSRLKAEARRCRVCGALPKMDGLCSSSNCRAIASGHWLAVCSEKDETIATLRAELERRLCFGVQPVAADPSPSAPQPSGEQPNDAELDAAIMALGDAIEKPHPGRLGEAVQAIARFVSGEERRARNG